MRIALDARALSGRYTGDRTYWRNLIGALAEIDNGDEYLIYSRNPIPEGDIPTGARFRPRIVESRNDRIWTLFAMSRALRSDKVDLVHVQYTSPPRALCPCPVVTTVHDISFRLFPHWFAPLDRVLMNLTVPISMRTSECVITDSESSRRDIQRIYHLPENKLFSVPLGLSAGFGGPLVGTRASRLFEAHKVIKERYGIDQPYILALGVLQPRKNLEMLADAYGKLKSKYNLPHKLALVGKAGWITGREAIFAAAERHGGITAREGIVFPGYVPDEELPIWFFGCSVFAHPALYEGFGIPPLEAMSCGVPVLVSDAPALPEVVGDAAVIVPAADSDAWAEMLHRLLTDEAAGKALAEKGPSRAADFSWRSTAQETREVYLKAIDAR